MWSFLYYKKGEIMLRKNDTGWIVENNLSVREVRIVYSVT